jgi:hypothetical protein
MEVMLRKREEWLQRVSQQSEEAAKNRPLERAHKPLSTRQKKDKDSSLHAGADAGGAKKSKDDSQQLDSSTGMKKVDISLEAESSDSSVPLGTRGEPCSSSHVQDKVTTTDEKNISQAESANSLLSSSENGLTVSDINISVKSGSSEKSCDDTMSSESAVSSQVNDSETSVGSSSGDTNKSALQAKNAAVFANVLPARAEKTSDPEKVKAFLEKAFSCTITLTDDIQRMRFSGGRMRVPPQDFPSTLDGLEDKMRALVHSAFDKQVNKVHVMNITKTFIC